MQPDCWPPSAGILDNGQIDGVAWSRVRYKPYRPERKDKLAGWENLDFVQAVRESPTQSLQVCAGLGVGAEGPFLRPRHGETSTALPNTLQQSLHSPFLGYSKFTIIIHYLSSLVPLGIYQLTTYSAPPGDSPTICTG